MSNQTTAIATVSNVQRLTYKSQGTEKQYLKITALVNAYPLTMDIYGKQCAEYLEIEGKNVLIVGQLQLVKEDYGIEVTRIDGQYTAAYFNSPSITVLPDGEIKHKMDSFIFGRLGRDPEIVHGDNGKVRTKYSVANDSHSPKRYASTWFNITAFDRTAELVGDYLKKGDNVITKASVTCKEYKGKHYWNVVASSINFVKGNKKREESASDSFSTKEDVMSSVSDIPSSYDGGVPF